MLKGSIWKASYSDIFLFYTSTCSKSVIINKQINRITVNPNGWPGFFRSPTILMVFTLPPAVIPFKSGVFLSCAVADLRELAAAALAERWPISSWTSSRARKCGRVSSSANSLASLLLSERPHLTIISRSSSLLSSDIGPGNDSGGSSILRSCA